MQYILTVVPVMLSIMLLKRQAVLLLYVVGLMQKSLPLTSTTGLTNQLNERMSFNPTVNFVIKSTELLLSMYLHVS